METMDIAWLRKFVVEDRRLEGRKDGVMRGGGNIAYIDGQNMYMLLKEAGWEIDWSEFARHLKEKHKVGEVYYFPGFYKESRKRFYKKLRSLGFTLVFKEHKEEQKSEKKGNADSLMIFAVLTDMINRGDAMSDVILVSGDGDFFDLVKFLIQKEKFKTILLPTRKGSSWLYQSLNPKHYEHLNREDVRALIEWKK